MTGNGDDNNRIALGLADPERENGLLLRLIETAMIGSAVEPLAAAVARLITDATETDVCFVHVLDDDERSLSLVGATPPFDSAVGQIQLPLGSGVTGWVASHQAPTVIVEHKEDDPRYVPFPALHGADFTSMASVPMATEAAGLVGVLNVHTVARREFTDRDIRLLMAIGSLVAGGLHQARTNRQLAARRRAHERFTEQIIEAQETERRRLAGDIHDGISQRLVTLSYHLDAAEHTVLDDAHAALDQLGVARGLLELTLREARAAIGGLRPPVLDDLGLAGAITSLARSVPDLDLALDLTEQRLPDHVEIALYRIAQEGLQNVVKHAGASAGRVRFTVRGDQAELEVTDNGTGFDPTVASGTEDGYGMQSMVERAELIGGTLRVRSAPGVGTTITAAVPATPVEPPD